MGLQDLYGQFQDLGADIIAISTDKALDAERMLTQQKLKFPVLYDTDAAVAKQWRIYDLLGDGFAAPATFVIDGTGKLAAWKIGQNFADRPAPGEVLALVKSIVGQGTARLPDGDRRTPDDG